MAGRRSTGDPELDADLAALLDDLGVADHRTIATELLVAAVRTVTGEHDRLDLKIVTAALAEMREAFAVFTPYRHHPKVTVFGSARTTADDPSYALATDVARRLADAGWMVVTGAGPGIMSAAGEGAGAQMSMGVSIRLPFETEADMFLAGDDKHVAMKYFFTRKLMLMKESKGFISLPGGFGTLDETFELLTLSQTGKADPVPIVLLEPEGGGYWAAVDTFLREVVAPAGLISPGDLDLYLRTHDAAEAVDRILEFHANFHSIRYVGDRLVVRLRRAPDADQLARLSARHGPVLARDGLITLSGPLPPEVADDDVVDLPRLSIRYGPRHQGKLVALIDDLPA